MSGVLYAPDIPEEVDTASWTAFATQSKAEEPGKPKKRTRVKLSEAQEEQLRTTRFPPVFDASVNLKAVDRTLLMQWVSAKITELKGSVHFVFASCGLRAMPSSPLHLNGCI